MIEIVVKNGLAHLCFQGEKSNALNLEQLQELSQKIAELGQNPELKVILISSAGEKAFCAGASFTQLSQIDQLSQAEAFFGGFAQVLCAMRDCPKIIVLQVQGKATGGAVGLIAAADYVVASPEAAVALTEINIGIGPFVIGPFVERKIGRSAFVGMALDARFRDALWAQQHHLFDVVSATHDGLLSQTKEITDFLLAKNPEALAQIKTMAWQDEPISHALLDARKKISARLLLSPQTKENIQKFLER